MSPVEDPGIVEEFFIKFDAPGMDSRVVSGVGVGLGDGDGSLPLDDDDGNRDSNRGGGARASGSAGGGGGSKRLELRKMRSGGMVSRLCLKTYLAMAEAKMAGWAGIVEGETAPFGSFFPVSAMSIFSNLFTSSAVISSCVRT